MRSYLIFNVLKCRTTITDSVCSRGCIIRHFGYAFSRAPYPTMEPGRCCSEHPDPASGRDAFRVGSLSSTTLPYRGYICGSSVPLVWFLGASLALPSPSRSLIRTIKLGYAIQFDWRPPKFRGIQFTSMLTNDAPVFRAGIAVLLAKDAIEPFPPADMRSGFYSLYFIVPKKGGGLRPILFLRILNWALHKQPFKMLTQKCIFECNRPQNWLHM